MPGQKILVVCGPTASGKTRLGAELARLHHGEVISGDSMQVYRGMDVGTAKPTKAEMRGVPHHMLDVAEPRESYSVARYAAEAAACADDILSRGKLPVVVGGTGLYIDALVSGRCFAAFSRKIRAQLQRRADAEGAGALLEELRRADPERAARLHEKDVKRIIRALEVYLETGATITEHDRRTGSLPPRYDALRLGLAFENRADQNAQIDRRVDEMMARGLAEEVAALLSSGVPKSCTAMQAIGYKELARTLEAGGPISDAVSEIKLRSRQYAKRQLTWFRREASVRWHLWGSIPDFSQAIHEATKYMEEFGL
jgi:tRNA dimethylallyltransferase